MILGARLNEVLNEGLQSEDDVLEALGLFEALDEIIHRALALGKLHLSVLLPEIIATHHRIDILHLFLLTLEQLTRQLIEGEISQSRVSDNGKLMEEAGKLHLSKHIIDSEHPLTSRQLRELLDYLHVLDKVHVALLGNGHVAALDLPARICQDIEVATKTEVLLVVWQEVQMEALVVADHQRVFDVIAIERDGATTDRRGEGILQHTDLIVVDVHIGKDILQHRGEDITRLHKIVDTRRVHTLDNDLLVVRLLAVNLLRDGLIDRYRQNELVVVRTSLHLVDQPLLLLIFRTIQDGWSNLIDSEGQFLIFVILIVVVVVEISLLLGSNHLLHHLDSRVILTTITPTLSLHGDFLQQGIIGFELDVVGTLDTMIHHHSRGDIADSAEGEHPSLMTGDGIMALDIGDNAEVVPLILHRGKGNGLTRLRISDGTCEHLLGKSA